MFGAWLADVFGAARTEWSLSDDDLADIARAGVRASFADDDVKAAILGDIDDWLEAP
jgi:adenosine deaminase